jgi:hypothetical protein
LCNQNRSRYSPGCLLNMSILSGGLTFYRVRVSGCSRAISRPFSPKPEPERGFSGKVVVESTASPDCFKTVRAAVTVSASKITRSCHTDLKKCLMGVWLVSTNTLNLRMLAV